MSIQDVTMIIIGAPHEQAFEDAYRLQIALTMKVRNEAGGEEEMILYPLEDFTYVTVVNKLGESVKRYTFLAVNDAHEDVIGQVTPGEKTESLGELCIRRKVEIPMSKKFRPAHLAV